MRLRLSIILAALCITAGAQTIRVTPQWVPQAQFAGLYVAEHLGFYEEEGLDVEIIHPSATKSSSRMLFEGLTDIITSQFTDALIYWDSGLKMVNILQCNENNSLMIVSHEPITSPQSLNGKRIGHWKAGFSDLGFIFHSQHNLTAEWIPFHSNIALYISGAIDATLAMEYNEYFQLKMSGTPLEQDQLLYMRDYGLNIQEDGFYVTPDYYNRNRTQLRKFVDATKKGWEWARKPENRGQALDIVMARLKEYDVHSNRVNQRYMLDTILRLQENGTGKAPYKLTRSRFEEAVQLMLDNGYIMKPVPFDEFVKTF